MNSGGFAARCATLWCLGLCASVALAAAFPDVQAQVRVRAATFEIVMKKPEADSLTYERPLPLELLPYTERTDKYASLGTAFAIAENRFVTAAHVLARGFESQFGEPALRATDGTVHAIDKIHRYSEEQDFAVFSLRSELGVEPLELSRQAQINDQVFAVGNALGEGIVIRDGLFTSETPEQRHGAWKWIRFSAAASPGNSGGPLLSSEGRVIGVVLGKSPNENLNYAVPIALVLDAPESTAKLLNEGWFSVPVMDVRESGSKVHEVPLPLSYPELSREAVRLSSEFYFGLKAELLRKQADSLFPRGAGSQQLLYSSITSPMPLIMGRREDGTWDAFQPPDLKTATLDSNGYITHGLFGKFRVAKFRRPDTVSAQTFYDDSKYFIDAYLKAVSIKRAVGREQVRIVSLGPAFAAADYVDTYGRKWQQRQWKIEYLDQIVTAMCLPVPDGYAMLIATNSTGRAKFDEDDLRTMADFSQISYGGTFKQWREFMTLRQLLPPQIARLDVQYEPGREFRFASPRFDVRYDTSVQQISDDSYLSVNFTFMAEGDEVTWDTSGVTTTEHSAAASKALVLARRAKPPATLPQEFAAEWEKLSGREFPHNGAVVDTGVVSVISSPYSYPARDGVTALPGEFAYEIAFAVPGKEEQAVMEAALTKVFQGFRLKEK